MTSVISVISLRFLWSQLFGGGKRGLWCNGGGEPVLLVSDKGGGGSIWGVLLSLTFSRSGVLSTVSSFTRLSSSEEDSERTHQRSIENYTNTYNSDKNSQISIRIKEIR